MTNVKAYKFKDSVKVITNVILRRASLEHRSSCLSSKLILPQVYNDGAQSAFLKRGRGNVMQRK